MYQIPGSKARSYLHFFLDKNPFSSYNDEVDNFIYPAWRTQKYTKAIKRHYGR